MTSLESSYAPQETAPQALNSLYARSLAMALVPSLLAVGALKAQTPPETASEGTIPPPPAAPATDKEVVHLESLEVKGERPTSNLASVKFTQPLVDVPQTFAIVPQEVFNQQGAATLSDVLRNTPGITFTAGEGGNVASGDTFTMRGFDTSGSIFIDGVRDSGAYSRDIYNTEQVEIAKGPAGADNGRGGTSGYVNLVTKTPQAENFVRATTSYGVSEHAGEDQRRASLDVNQSLAADRIQGAALRLNLYGQDSGVPGRDHAENTGWGAAPSLAFGLGSPTRLLLAGAYNAQDNLPDTGVPAAGLRDGLYRDPDGASTVLVPAESPVAGDISHHFYGFADHDYETITARSALARIEHDFTPDTRFGNQTKVAGTDRDALTSYIQNPAAFNENTDLVTVRRLRSVSDNQILSNQTNLTTSFDAGPVVHDLSAGLELSRETQFNPLYTAANAGTASITDPDAHRDPSFTPARVANGAFNKARIDSAALYAFDTLHLTEKVLLNVSGRLEHYDSEFSSLVAPTGPVPNPPVVRLDGSDTLFSYKTGIVFKPRPEGSLYAAYGNSFTPPGATFTFSTQAGNANDPATEPQEAHNYEVGVKWEFFEKRLSTSLAFYRSINENVATNLGTTAAPNFTYDKEQRSEGVEFGVSGRITPEWLVFGGIGYIETETASRSDASTDGADLRYTPKVSASLWTTYALFKKLTIGGGAQYTETVSRSTTTTTSGSTAVNGYDTYVAIEVPSYWVFNALAEYAITENVSLRLNVNNVFDEEYYRLNNNGGRYYPGASRTYVLSADFRF